MRSIASLPQGLRMYTDCLVWEIHVSIYTTLYCCYQFHKVQKVAFAVHGHL